MADVQEASLYDRDFYQWALDQARAVQDLRDAAARPGSNFPVEIQALDWDNLIEELEGLAKGVRSELRKRIATVVEPLAKLELSPAEEPRRGWEETIYRSRFDISELLDDNPSLRRELPGIMATPLMAKAARFAMEELVRHGEVSAKATVPDYTLDQIVEKWWPVQRGNEP